MTMKTTAKKGRTQDGLRHPGSRSAISASCARREVSGRRGVDIAPAYAGSVAADRHGRSSAGPYGCFLPDLTRFEPWRRPGPSAALVCDIGSIPEIDATKESVTKPSFAERPFKMRRFPHNGEYTKTQKGDDPKAAAHKELRMPTYAPSRCRRRRCPAR